MAAEQFISALGLRTLRIHRVQGYDLQNLPSKFYGVWLVNVQAHQCGMPPFHRMLHQKAAVPFEEHPWLRFL